MRKARAARATRDCKDRTAACFPILDRMTDIAALRTELRASSTRPASAADPMQQFETWLEQAIDGQLPSRTR